jgi:hypothetical protein
MRRFVVILAVIMLSACAGQDSHIADKLDLATGVTITYSETPMVFFRDDSGKAAHARNLIHMGPIEVNRMGEIRYFLWLGIWNTVQETDLSEARDGFESIVIFADGEPLPLELAGWTSAAIGAGDSVYLRPVASAADAYFEVTVDQLRLIASSRDIRVQSTSPSARTYEMWDDQNSARSSLIEFLKQSVY